MRQPKSILEIGMIYTLHELKNPLTSIILTLEQLENGEVENPEVYHARIKKHANQLSKSISELCACYEMDLTNHPLLPEALESTAAVTAGGINGPGDL